MRWWGFGGKRWSILSAIGVIILLSAVGAFWHWSLGGIFYANSFGNIYEQKKTMVDCGGWLSIGCHVKTSYSRLSDAHLWNFTRVGNSFGKTRTRVYCGASQMRDTDPASFELLSGNYAKDKNHLYTGSNDEFDHACLRLFRLDPTTGESTNFKLSQIKVFSDCNLISDANGVYVSNLGTMDASRGPGSANDTPEAGYYDIILRLNKISGADPKTFIVTNAGRDSGNNPNCSAKDENGTYTISWHGDGNASRINGWEVTSTNVSGVTQSTPFLTADYTFKGGHVFFRDILIDGADPSTFSFLAYYYGKDANHVYYKQDMVLGADPNTFGSVTETSNFDHFDDNKQSDFVQFGKDVSHVYVGKEVIQGADPKSFSLLTFGYGKDAHNVYYMQHIVPGADIASFTWLQFGYANDRTHVYRLGKVVGGADPNTYRQIAAGEYSFDSNHVFYRGVKIPKANPNTWVAPNDYIQKDFELIKKIQKMFPK